MCGYFYGGNCMKGKKKTKSRNKKTDNQKRFSNQNPQDVRKQILNTFKRRSG